MRRLALVLALASSLPAAAAEVTLLANARIHHGDGSTAQAMAWDANGRVLALGTDAGLRSKYPQAEVVDAGGRAVVPGLIDAHAHLMGLGYALMNADLMGADSKAEIVRRLQAFAAELPKDAWLLGRGWDQNRWPEKRFPTAADLDAAFPDRPVYLKRVDGHAGWANSAAMRAVERDLSGDWQPEGGRIDRADGRATGVFIDGAMALVEQKIPAPGAAYREQAFARALAESVKFGLTGVHDMGVSLADLALYRKFADSGRLPLRVTAYADGDRDALTALCAFGPLQHDGGRLTMRGVKLYADGALGSRGAAMLADYHDDAGNRGLLVTSADGLEAAMVKARDCGVQVAAHAIGDRGNRLLLDLMAEVLGERAEGDHRWRIEHAQIVAVEDIPRFAALNVQASMQPTHATSDMPWAGDRVGADRLPGAYAWRRFLEAGVALPLGSDFPVEQVNPMLGLHAAATRQDAAGNPPGGWLPDQKLTIAEALHGFTAAAAQAGFAENEVGRLAPGHRADFVILDADPFAVSPSQLDDLKVRATYVDGRAVYEAR